MTPPTFCLEWICILPLVRGGNLSVGVVRTFKITSISASKEGKLKVQYPDDAGSAVFVS